MLDAIFEAIGELAMGDRGAANRLVLMARSIEAYAKDRSDTESVAYTVGDDGKVYVSDYKHGETPDRAILECSVQWVGGILV
jgi:hypothetical protein